MVYKHRDDNLPPRLVSMWTNKLIGCFVMPTLAIIRKLVPDIKRCNGKGRHCVVASLLECSARIRFNYSLS